MHPTKAYRFPVIDETPSLNNLEAIFSHACVLCNYYKVGAYES